MTTSIWLGSIFEKYLNSFGSIPFIVSEYQPLLEFISFNTTFTFKTTVSKGCYIRSLIRDIGLSLNTYATMTNLIRTKQGNFTIEEADTLENIEKGNFKLHKIEDVLDYPKIIVDNNNTYNLNPPVSDCEYSNLAY